MVSKKGTISVYGMTCGNCVKKVTDKLSEIKDISNIKVSLENKNAEFSYHDESILDQVKTAIHDIGYQTTQPEPIPTPSFINDLGTLPDLSLNAKQEDMNTAEPNFPTFNFENQLGTLPSIENTENEIIPETQSGEIQIAVPIQGMHCASCAASIEKALNKDPNINSAQVNYANEKAYINYNKAPDLNHIQTHIANAGDYKVPTEKVELYLEGMHCASCAITIEKGLQEAKGVIEAKVNFASEKAYLQIIPGVSNIVDLKQKVTSLGYKAKEVAKGKRDEDINNEKRSIQQKLVIGIVLALPVMILSMGSDMLNWSIPNLKWILFFLTIPVQFYVGSQFLKGAFINAKHFRANMDTLVSLGTLAAFIYSTLVTLNIINGYLYFEASAVVITLVLLGKYFEAIAKGKTSDAIKKLMGLQVKTARGIRDNIEIDLPIDELVINDEIIIKPGEKIPVDGIVLSGKSHIDQSMVTGEPLPVSIKQEDSVIAGTVNQEGSVIIKAKKIGSETLLSRMIEMVEEAQGAKPNIQRMVDKVASIFVPFVLVIALITLTTWLIVLGTNGLNFNESLPQALINTVAVLVIACPCALGLATPTAIMVATGIGAKNGILIKNGESLETLYQMNTVIFDKTGTITEGKPKVNSIISINGFSESEIIQYSASLERHSEHPIGQSILKKADSDNIELLNVLEFKAISGKGITGLINDTSYFIGNIKYMQDQDIEVEDSIRQKYESEQDISIFLAKDNQLIGIILISDIIRREAKETISYLHKMKLKSMMLTGDKVSTAKVIANQIGIDQFEAELLPENKIGAVKELQNKDQKVIMVGDGINDAPALAQADIGIAMQSGTDIAMEAADITIMKNNLLSVVEAINLSKKTMRTIKGNLFWAFIYNIIGIPIAALGYLDPMVAGTAMAMSSISVVTHSLLLKRKKLRAEMKSS